MALGLRSPLRLPDFARGDPHFANVVSLLHFDGANGSSTITDQIAGRTWTSTGTALISTTQSVFGGSSLELTSTGQNRIDCSDAAFNFGTGDYTIEIRFRPDANSRAAFSFGNRLVYTSPGGWTYFNGGNSIIGSAVTVNTFVEICLTRASGVTRVFINGTQSGGNYAGDSGVAINPGNMRIGYFNAGNPSGRYYDEFRVTAAVARHVSNYTPDGVPYLNY